MSVAPQRKPPILPPGTYLEEWIEDNDLNQAQVAERLDCSSKHVNRVINGHVPISPAFASKLELVTQIPSEFWLVHQAKYDARTFQIAVSSDDVEIVRNLIPGHCLAFFRRRGLVTKSWRDPEELVRELYRRFRVSSVHALQKEMTRFPSVAYRQSEAYEVETVALRFWLLAANDCADGHLGNLPPYSEVKLRDSIKALRDLTVVEPSEFVSRAADILAGCGVGLFVMPDLRGARVNGASFLKGETPIIIVTDRHHREDIFWFTLFHEIAHVLNGDLDRVNIDIDLTNDEQEDPREKRANEFAAPTLIPSEVEAQLRSVTSKQDVSALASKTGVSVGIIIGRMHHLKLKEPSWGRDMIRRFDAEG